MTTACIVQARCGSSRFPFKVLANLCGLPVLWHVLSRCRRIEGLDMVILAAPDEPDTRRLEAIAWPLGVRCYRGSETDVLGRFLGAARHFELDYMLRITADCPLIDPELCRSVLRMVTADRVDYASNCYPIRTYEKGLDCEAFSRRCLEMTAHRAQDPYDREHVTSFMQRSTLTTKGWVKSGRPERADTNWCLDYPHDLARLRGVMGCS